MPNLKKMTDKIKSLDGHTNGTEENIHAETGVFRAEVTIPRHYETEFIQLPPDDKHAQGYLETNCDPVKRLDLKRLKKAIVSYGMHSFV